jgi:hypothetical protein
MQESESISRKRWLILITLICIAGVTLRLYLFFQAEFKIDYDEAMIALNARHFLFEGKLEAFVPGQSTLANIEAFLLAPFFLLIGPNIYAVRAYSLVITIMYIITSTLLGQEIKGKKAGLIAGLLAAIAPAYLLVTGTKVWGTTIETIVLGNLLFIAMNKMAQKPNTQAWAIISGLSAGLMFWCSWLSFYYLIPVFFVGVWKQKHIRQWLPVIIATFIIGSLPLWLHNLIHNFDSLQTVLGQTQDRGVSRIDTAIKLATEQYPVLLTGFSAWASIPAWANITAIGIYTSGLVALGYHSIKTRHAAGLLCLGLLITLPLLYIQSGYARSGFNTYGVDSTGRYLLMLHSILPIGIAVLIEYMRPRLLQIGIILMILISNLVITLSIKTSWAFDSPYYNRQPEPRQLGEVTNYLLEHEIYFIWTDVGIAQPLMFMSREQIIAADYHDYIVGGIPRFPEALQAVWAADQTAYLVAIIPNQENTPLSRSLDQLGVTYETQDFGNIRLYIPQTLVNPEDVIQGLGLQY